MSDDAASTPVPADHMQVAVITPEGPAYEGLAKSLVLTAHDGEVAFLPGHAPFVGAIGTGELRIETDAGVERSFLDGGVVQVLDSVVTILAERIVPAAEVDGEQAKQDLEAALAEVPTEPDALLQKERAVNRARAKIRIAAHRS